jgi:DtxR family Mn-dependent transcriptional regulator
MSSIIKENYLKALFFLNEKDSSITLTDLGKSMQVSKPTVNDMVKKLEARGWIHYTKYKPLKITEEGKRTAALVIRKHRLSEMFLAQIMGFGWEEVHDIAEELEHIKSDKFFERMDEIMGYPNVDPHGSPIPDKDGNITRPNYMTLADVKAGSRVIFKALRNSSTELLQFLNKKELTLGTELEIHEIEAFDKSMTVSFSDKANQHLSQSISAHILVEVI